MKVVLKVTTNKASSEIVFSSFEKVILGRSKDANYQLNDDRVSSTHCRFLLQNDRLEIYDLDSKNGTYLNGIRIEQSEVFIGDEIKIGNSTITILEGKMQSDSIDALTFPGPHKARLSYELKADFTGARIQNQTQIGLNPSQILMSKSHVQEIAIRKTVQSKIKVSKEEIIIKNRTLERVAMVIDSIFMIAICVGPLMWLAEYDGKSFLWMSIEEFKDWKTHIIGFIELMIIAVYVTFNRAAKFTLGEKVAGLEEKYNNQ